MESQPNRLWRVETAETTLIIEAPTEAVAREKALAVVGEEGDVCFAFFIEPYEPGSSKPTAAPSIRRCGGKC